MLSTKSKTMMLDLLKRFRIHAVWEIGDTGVNDLEAKLAKFKAEPKQQ